VRIDVDLIELQDFWELISLENLLQLFIKLVVSDPHREYTEVLLEKDLLQNGCIFESYIGGLRKQINNSARHISILENFPNLKLSSC
jgi:hypothetical protein